MIHVTHERGPLDGGGNDVSLAAPRTPLRLFYAKAPAGVPNAAITTSGHMLVGYDQPPERDWPGQVEYTLDRERSELRQHRTYDDMEEGTAVFVFVE